MSKHRSLESLDERATRAIEEAQSLVRKRQNLLTEMTLHYELRTAEAHRATAGLQKTEAALGANYPNWLAIVGEQPLPDSN